MKNIKIYALVDKTTDEMFYVGSTLNSLKHRLREHVWEVKSDYNINIKKINKFFEVGCDNVGIILLQDNLSEKTRLKQEQLWFDLLTLDGCDLVNYYRPRDTNLYTKTPIRARGENVYCSILLRKDVLEIIDLYKYTNMLVKDIAPLYNVKPVTIHKIIEGKTWKHITKGKVISIYSKRKASGFKKYWKTNRQFTKKQILEIIDFHENELSLVEISKIFNVSISTIHRILTKRAYKDITNKINFKYKSRKRNVKAVILTEN